MVATIILIALLFTGLIINIERHGQPKISHNWEYLNYYNAFIALVEFAVWMILLYYTGAFENFK
jgi:hypothetical protein